MIKAKKNSFQFAIVLTLGLSTPAPAADSIFGLPASTTTPSEVVGSLPYTNQWISEKTASYLYLSYNSSQMSSRNVTVGQYVSDFGSAGYAFPTIDFFTNFVSLAGPESRSLARDFSFWGRYSLGFADRSGQLSATQTPINGSVENVSLLVFSARVGALLGYERWNWFRPYAGLEIDPYFFRNTSGISGAEQQGENFSYGPVVGAHFPVLLSGHASLLAEFRRTIAASGSGQLFSSANNYTAGMGLTF